MLAAMDRVTDQRIEQLGPGSLRCARRLHTIGARIGPLLLLVALVVPSPAAAWIWPEHRDIAVEAVRGLSAAERRTLETMWGELTSEAGPQLCTTLVSKGAEPRSKFGEWSAVCIDFPSYPALGGDHSCSTADLRAVTERQEWGRKVVWVAEQTKVKLAEAGASPERLEVWNRSHLAMQYVDPAYLTRAAGNNAHFLMPRAGIDEPETIASYVDKTLAEGAGVNATAMYVQYHVLALRLAAQYHAAPDATRPDLARRTLLAEGIALHFLEDSFSSGHYAATWGTAAWQKGTHDLYCEIGLTSMTWDGDLFASHGDAHMLEREMKVAGTTIRKSLSQLTAAATGSLRVSPAPMTPEEKAVEDLDFCKAKTLPPMPLDAVAKAEAVKTLQKTPVPSGDQTSIHPPRARADIGPFAGVVAGITIGPAFSGYDTEAGWRFRSEFEVGARFGYGLEGVLTKAMDGQVWAQATFVADPAQLDVTCPGCPGGKRTNPALPRVPARSALKLALRMPYYVVPFDLLLVGPVLFFTSKDALQEVVFASSSGGLLGVQRPMPTSLGTFQFMAGREVGLTLWGYVGSKDQWIATPTTPPNPATSQLVDYKSLEFDFPVFEYAPPRAFATTLSLAANFQVGFSVEFPQNAVLPQQGNASYTGLAPSWFVYLRLRLDARKYFGGASEDWSN